ncbi:MerR family transcriptional regulator [Agromyces sp. CFH 90414]|uniref:MerR family transcriptional regulator n=1 Tax=Agromyces agglutinans TaxID=2662258 RepID=A0A6I2F4L5_9MICO|nr:MerR family transcriptional regulator [Agromyces agglutinans]MRG59529.1 MerR family transcriptional regulator [Agromyces agglutinans]
MSNPPFSTADLGRLVGYSTQQVRDLERLGVLPAAERAANGYRRFGEPHLVAIQAYRALAAAVGPVEARRLMPALLPAPVDEAAELVDDLHASIARERANVRAARSGLDVVLAETEAPFDDRDAMTVGELAQALGVRASALRHWEQEGLVHPDRTRPSRARRYDARAIAEARIVAALRAGGYGIPAIARVLGDLHVGGLTAPARDLLDERLDGLTRRSIRLLEASAQLHRLLEDRRDHRANDPADERAHAAATAAAAPSPTP